MEKLISGAVLLGLELTSKQIEAFEIYHHELINWNYKFNLTAITTYEEVQTKHFLDSLTAVGVYNFLNDPSVIDVGTGAGFPGLPLKIAFPGIHLALLEATAKKVVFLENIISKLGLNGVEIITGRSEEIAHDSKYREKYDVVLSRAVAALPSLVELTLPLCITGGQVIAYKKGDVKHELEQAGKAIAVMGGKLKKIAFVDQKLFDDERYLVVINKVTPTPPEFPRRPGMPVKRPLLS